MELQARAFSLHMQAENGDDRSELYAQADERAASGRVPLRRVGTKRPANWAAALHAYETSGASAIAVPMNTPLNEPPCMRKRAHWAAGEATRACLKTSSASINGFASTPSPSSSGTSTRAAGIRPSTRASSIFRVGSAALTSTVQTGQNSYSRGWLNRQLLWLKNGSLSQNRAERISTLLATWNESAP